MAGDDNDDDKTYDLSVSRMAGDDNDDGDRVDDVSSRSSHNPLSPSATPPDDDDDDSDDGCWQGHRKRDGHLIFF